MPLELEVYKWSNFCTRKFQYQLNEHCKDNNLYNNITANIPLFHPLVCFEGCENRYKSKHTNAYPCASCLHKRQHHLWRKISKYPAY